MQSHVLLIEDRSHVGAARRAASELASTFGFDAEGCGRVALAVTEAATNILKHAGHGRLVLRGLVHEDVAGLEILALDRGPGIADMAASLRDGQSTTGTAGTGLGALRRLSSTFDVYSRPGAGTALRLELWNGRVTPAPAALEIGAVCAPKLGEIVPGDDWAVVGDGAQVTVLVADGLGHGPQAAHAARTATQVLRRRPKASPGELLEACHERLASTRGAAVAAARINFSTHAGTLAAVGNIAARVQCDTTERKLISHNGTVGHNMGRVQEDPFDFPAGAWLVLHTDGLDTRWSAEQYPGLAAKHAGLIAGVLYRDHDRGRDDVTVVVVRRRERMGGQA